MARILDVYRKQEARPRRASDDSAARVLRVEPTGDAGDEENSDVPFIEVGAPSGRIISKGLQAPASPMILPLQRPAPGILAEPQPIVTQPAPVYFHISFQTLPTPKAPLLPAQRRFAPELVAFHAPDHPVAEQYRALIRELEKQLGPEQQKSLLFAATESGAGTTSVVLNLAITLARRGTRVIIVDANPIRPALAERLGLSAHPGLQELLTRTVPLAWAILESGLPNLRVIGNGKPAGDSSLAAWPALHDQLRRKAEWLLIDAGVWNDQANWPACSEICQASYLVVRPEDTSMEKFPQQSERLRGYVLVQK